MKIKDTNIHSTYISIKNLQKKKRTNDWKIKKDHIVESGVLTMLYELNAFNALF